jgi:hypothetical protein
MSTPPNTPNPPAPEAGDDIAKLRKALESERNEHKETRARLSTLRTDLGRITGLGEDAPIERIAERLGVTEKAITDRLAPVITERDEAVKRAQTLEQEKRSAILDSAVDRAIARSGVKAEAVEDAKLHLRAALEVNEKGEVVTKAGSGEVAGQSPDWFVVSRLRSLRPGYWEVSRGGGARGSAGNNPANAVDDRCFNPRDPVNHSITAQGKFYVRYGAAAAEAARRKYGGGR